MGCIEVVMRLDVPDTWFHTGSVGVVVVVELTPMSVVSVRFERLASAVLVGSPSSLSLCPSSSYTFTTIGLMVDVGTSPTINSAVFRKYLRSPIAKILFFSEKEIIYKRLSCERPKEGTGLQKAIFT